MNCIKLLGQSLKAKDFGRQVGDEPQFHRVTRRSSSGVALDSTDSSSCPYLPPSSRSVRNGNAARILSDAAKPIIAWHLARGGPVFRQATRAPNGIVRGAAFRASRANPAAV